MAPDCNALLRHAPLAEQFADQIERNSQQLTHHEPA